MNDMLNPVSPRNPNSMIIDGNGEDSQKESGYIEGSEMIPLPSRGVFYTYNPTFQNLEELRVRQLDYTDEDVLTTKSYLQDGSVFFEILKNTIVDDNGFKANGLVPVDRDTILFWLRSTAFGNDFNIQIECPACKTMNNVTWDLSALEIPKYDDEVYEELKVNGEYTITTPLRNLKVKIAVPSIGKSKEAEKMLSAKKINQKEKTDFFGTGTLLLAVTAVETLEGKILRKKDEIERYFKQISLPLSDARYIRRSLNKINLKYETAKTVICDNCEHVQEGVELPLLHPNFLWSELGV